jgi:hypothetical protein
MPACISSARFDVTLDDGSYYQFLFAYFGGENTSCSAAGRPG